MGRQFHEHCARALNEIKEAADAAQASSSEPRGHLRVTAPGDFATNILSPLLANFLKKYPQISIELVLSDSILDLVRDNIDVAIRVGKLNDSNLRAKKIGRDVFQLCASPRYLKNAPPLKEPFDLKNHQCLIFAPKPEMAVWKLKNGSSRYTFQPQSVFKANHVSAITALVATGAGIALLPISNCHREMKSGEIEIVLPDWMMEDAPIHLIYQKLAFTLPKVQAFNSYMEQELKKYFS
jgi:DNA-binding transcriptional LysR family regulator